MTEPERRALRHALDRHRRAAICGDLAAEPTLVGCCDHCGRRYGVGLSELYMPHWASCPNADQHRSAA